jgi:hypothetical protein
MAMLAILALISASDFAQEFGPGQYRVKVQDYDFTGHRLEEALRLAAGSDCVKIMFDVSVEEAKRSAGVNLKLKRATPSEAIRALIKSQGLGYEYSDNGHLVVFHGKAPKSIKLMDVIYRSMPFSTAIDQLAQGHFNIVIDDAAKAVMRSMRLDFEERDLSRLRALEEILETKHLTYHRVACDMLFIHFRQPPPSK